MPRPTEVLDDRPQDARSRVPPLWVGLGLLVLGLVGAWEWSHRRVDDAVRSLPAAERQHLYERTLQTLQTSCHPPSHPGLSSHCEDEADFITHFPECDAACRELAQVPHHATR